MKIIKIIFLLNVLAFNVWSQAGSPDSDFLYARKLYEDKLYNLAAQEFAKFIRNYPSDQRTADARFYSGMANFGDKQFENARRDFQFLAIDYPKDKRAPEAWIKIADCYVAQNDYAGAANALSSVATLYPDAPNAIASILLASDYLLKVGDRAGAKEKLQRLISDRPESVEADNARFKVGQMLIGSGDDDRALGIFQNVLERSKDFELLASTMYEKAKIYDRLGKSDDARSLFIKISVKYVKTKSYANAVFELASIAFKEKNFAEAQSQFELVTRVSNNLSLKRLAEIRLGDIYYAQNSWARANDLYKRVADGEKDSTLLVEASFKSGVVSEMLSLPGAANDRFLAVIGYADKVPDSRYVLLAYLKLAQTNLNQKKFREAASYYAEIVLQFPKYEKLDRVYYERGKILKNELREFNEATLAFQLMARDFPKSPLLAKAQIALAQSLRASNQIPEAIKLLKDFRFQFPGSELIASADQELKYIQDYSQYGQNNTTENLINLMGALIEGRPKDEVGLTYAKLFFEQLKDYQTSVRLFNNVLATSVKKEIIEEANLYLAKSYERLAVKQQNAALLDSGIQIYKKLVNGRQGDVASLKVLDFSLQKISSPADRANKAKEVYSGLLERYPNSALRDKFYFNLGNALLERGEILDTARVVIVKDKKGVVLVDSTKKPLMAMHCYDTVISKYALGEFVEDAYFQKIIGYRRIELKAEYLQALNRYASTFPRGERIAQVKFWLARIKEEQNEFNSAISNYEEITAQYFYTLFADSAIQSIGQNYLLAQKFEKAIAAFELANARQQTDFADAMAVTSTHNPSDFKIGYCYEKLNNFTLTVQKYQTYLYPDYSGEYAVQALNSLAKIYERKEDYNSSLPYYQILGQRYASTEVGFQALNRVAEIFFTTARYDSARRTFQKLASLSSDKMKQIILDSRVIVCAYRAGNVAETTLLEKAFFKKYEDDKKLKLLMDNYAAEFQYELGRTYQYNDKQTNFELAYKTYARIVENYKNAAVLPDVLYEMGIVRFSQGKSAEGFELLKQCAAKFPDNDIVPRVYLRMAFEAFRLEQVSGAVDASKMALQNPRLKRADAKIGTAFLIKVYKAAGYYENSLLLIQQYLEKFPEDDPANIMSMRIDIGVMHKNLKSYDRALQYFKDLSKTASGEDEAEIQFNIAETYWAMENFSQALLEYLRIPYLTLGKKFDWASAAKSQAAECYVKLSKYAEAIRLYEDIAKSSGNNSDYSNFARKRIEDIRQIMKN